MPNPIPAQLRFAVLATDVVCFRVVSGRLEVLLGKVHIPPFYKNRWGLIGGLIHANETAEQSVERHLATKAGTTKVYREQLATFSRIDRDPRNRVISVAYIALLSGGEGQEQDDVLGTRWCPITDVPRLAYDHDEILAAGIERLRSKLSYTNIARHLMPATFPLSELQRAYEAVLGHAIDKRNFRKHLHTFTLVKDTGRVLKKGAQRPAALYAFTGRGVRVLDLA